MKERVLLRRCIAILLAGIFGAAILYAYILAVEQGYLTAAIHDTLHPRLLGALFVGCVVIAIPFACWREATLRYLFTYRWLIAVLLFAACTVFEISGSSIGVMVDSMGGDGSVLVGRSRGIRSDEWMVSTPMAISQCLSDGGVFSYFQDSFRGVPTDMFLLYGQPAWDIAEFFRPFHWGYLLLGASRGLPFYWSGRFIFLFMVSFEFAYQLLTDRSKMLGVGYAFLIAFSSVVQWWFAINGLVEMLLFGQLALILASFYLATGSYRKRLACTVGIAWCLGAYVLSLYPAWQVPFAYVFLALLIALLVHRLPSAHTSVKDIGLMMLLVGIVVLLIVYVVFIRSWETVQILSNTAYPGDRKDPGGGSIDALLSYPLTVLLPIYESVGMPNAPEAASFYCLFPLNLLLPIWIAIRSKRVSPLCACLGLAALLLAWYVVIGLPEPLAKITLLDRSQPSRAVIACQYALIILFFAALPHVRALKRVDVILMLAVSGLVVIMGAMGYIGNVGMAKTALVVLIALLFMGSIASCRTQAGYRLFVGSCIVVGLACGALANPLRTGLGDYLHTEVAIAMKEAAGEQSLIAVADAPLQTSNYLASLGYRTLNSTNTYPQLETWRKINQTGEDEETYNRYAHITISLKEAGDPEFTLLSPDLFHLDITPEDLKELGVDMVVSSRGDQDLEDLVPQADIGDLYIYSLG